MKRVMSAAVPFKLLTGLMLLGLILLLLPMINASRFDVPSADDYTYGLQTHEIWEQTHSCRAVIKTAWSVTRETWQGWQGTFSAVFLFALNPLIFGEQYYLIGPLLIIAMLLTGVFFLSFTVWKKIFRAGNEECIFYSVIWAVLCTQFLPRASQGIYWYNGAVYYTFFFGLAAIAYAMLIRFILNGKDAFEYARLAAVSVLLFLIGGGNLVTGLTTAVLLVSAEFLLILVKREEWKKLLLPIICFFIAFMINVSAPGNEARQKYFSQPGLFRAVLLSFKQLWILGSRWFSLPVLALILASAPVSRRVAARTHWDFRLPWLVTLYSICLSAVMFYPPIYAMTDRNLHNLGRITNIIYFGMTFLAIFNLFYWIGWFHKKRKALKKEYSAERIVKYPLIYLLSILIIFSFGMTRIQWFDTTSVSALRSYQNGTMGNYLHVYKMRLEILKDPNVEDAVLKRFGYRPYVLFFHELSENPNENRDIALYYGKKSVVAK